MSNEELIKEEARDFIEDNLDYFAEEARGYRLIMDKINSDVSTYYSHEHKMTYFLELKNILENHKEHHKLICTLGEDQSKCSTWKYYAYIDFFWRCATRLW